MRIVFFILMIPLLTVSYANAKDTCLECHRDRKFQTENRVLFDYYRNWRGSVHDREDVSCADCHGGDRTEKDKEKAHINDFTSLTHRDKDAYKKITDRCGRCHKEILKHFTGSKHYKALLEKATGPHCSTCHGSVNTNVYYSSVIWRSCKECHNEYTENHPEVVEAAGRILDRINVSSGLMRWVLPEYYDAHPEKVNEIRSLYKDVARSWHAFDFTRLDQKSLELLDTIESLINKNVEAKQEIK
jgi:hypothetical protein